MADRYTGVGTDSSEIDRQIDAALAKYAAIEPRAGLEKRILANVRAERTKIDGHASWKWALLAAALILAVAAWAWRLDKPHHPAVARQIPVSPQNVASVQKPAAAGEAANAQHREGHHAARRWAPQASQARMEGDPKLFVFPSAQPAGPDAFPSPQAYSAEVFPSPRPVSAKERALARYVSNFPADAKLVAEAQEASVREVMQKMQAFEKEPTDPN